MKKLATALIGFLLIVVLSACSAVAPSNSAIEPTPGSGAPLPSSPVQPTEVPSDYSDTKEQAAPLISPEKAYVQMGKAIFLDVRTAEEYTQEHIPGAYLIPVDEIAARAQAELPKDSTLYVYCRTGRRSALAALELSKLGYTHVFDLGGIVDWPYETAQGAFEQWNSADSGEAVIAADILDGVELLPDDEDAQMPDLCGTGDDCE